MKTQHSNQPLLICLAAIQALLVTSCSTLPKDTTIDARSIQTCSNEAVERFEFARDNTQGLIVTNPTNEEISFPQAYWRRILKYYWTPVNGKKVTACGHFIEFGIYDGQLINDSAIDEYDWNLEIIPAAQSSDIVGSVTNIRPVTDEWTTEQVNGATIYTFKAEITPDESLYDNEWFPNLGHNNETRAVVNPNICAYGPWVMDEHHDRRPEIHPAEVIWWHKKTRATDEYYIFGIQDDSNRYDEKSDFEGEIVAGWKPWAAPPITTQVKIPFEYSGQFTDHLIVNIEAIRARNIVTSTMSNSGDSDNGKNHILRFNKDGSVAQSPILPSNILVEVNETQSSGNDLGVRFVDICRNPDGNIMGYIQIFTAYGKGIAGDEGYHVLKVTLNHPSKPVPGIKER